VLVSSFTVAIASFLASRTLHNNLLNNILKSPMSFFDTTPLGRILNRFSKDVNIIDETVPRSLRAFLTTVFSVFSTIIAVSIALPIFLVVILPVAAFYILVQVRMFTYRGASLVGLYKNYRDKYPGCA
jgi:ABC-type multidrug transport system fused ATPase/permease subunit